jgi:putative ABC transport system permease protein
VTAWYAGVEASSVNRLITRQAVSFIFPLPYSYKEKITSVSGVENVTFANWFGGIYKDKNQFFARMAVDAPTFFDIYPEWLVNRDQLETFKRERNSCIVGEDIAKQYGFKVGQVIPLEGDIYPGRWEFVVRGIYKKRDRNTDGTNMVFHWDALNERLNVEAPVRANEVGWYIVKLKPNANAAEVSRAIDALFQNSADETKSETERAFTQNFIAASGAIMTAMNYLSFVIIGIILLVLGNTMIMSARERTREYAVFKTLGFSGLHLTGLIMGESLFISILGGGLGLMLSVPMIKGVEENIPKGFFPIFNLEPITVILAVLAALSIGLLSALFPVHRAVNTKIVDGFRFVG